MGYFKRKNHFDVDGRTVLITGGSTGMGRALAKLLASKGANVVIVARTQKNLDEALEYIKPAAKSPGSQRFHAISADVTSAVENERIITEVTEWNNGQPADIVWANAGASYPALFLDTPLETLRAQMDINYWAAAYLAQVTLKSWLKPFTSSSTSDNASAVKPRHFLITSSSIAFVGLAGYGPYAPAKAALRSLADSLRSEVNLYNGARRRDPSIATADVKIHCVLPGTINTPGLANEEKTKHEITKILESGDPVQTEDEVAAAAVKGLERGGYLVTTQIMGHALRVGALAGSPRNGWGIIDTLFSWAVSIAWLFVGPDLDSKVVAYGKQNGINSK
ncbi:NAD(P)-binding protein [Polychaeton citri CBS 116435]|uniref:3-dehydrosphinganine reductase n=1 Tax=Polychaeton citri CBS 116435 TaxID=1314669 RepID=A0A9P4Q3Y6_9PEZI|nr:NAD(P)-binding protein [Polychaeton citri CBS 116435]